MFKRLLALIILIPASLVLVTQFQNCAPEGAFSAASMNLDATAKDAVVNLSLDDHPVEEFSSKPISQFSSPLMDRQMVSAILEHAFGPSWKIESANIETLRADFGKTCSIYSEYWANDRKHLGQDSEVCRFTYLEDGVQSLATPVRSSYLITACSDLSENSTTFNYFLSQLGSASSRNNFSDESLEKAYHLFFVSKPSPSQSVIDSMRFIGMSQDNPAKAWAAIAFSLCASGQWQVL